MLQVFHVLMILKYKGQLDHRKVTRQNESTNCYLLLDKVVATGISRSKDTQVRRSTRSPKSN